MVAITLPDGSVRQFDKPVTVGEVAASIGPGLAKAALGGKVAGKPRAGSPPRADHAARLPIVTDKGAEGLDLIRPSTAPLTRFAIESCQSTAVITSRHC